MGAIAKTINGVAQGWLWLTVLLMPILALAGGLGFQIAGFSIGLSAGLALVVDRTGAAYLRAAWPIWLLGFLLWAWVSTLWSPHEASIWNGNASVLFCLVLALLFAPLAILKTPQRFKSALIWTVIAAGLVGTALLLIDAVSGFAISIWADPVNVGEDPVQRRSDAEMNLGRGQVSYAQLLWPVAALLIMHLKHGWALALAAFLSLIISAHFNNLTVVIPTFLLAGGFAVIAWHQPKLGLTLAFVLAIVSVACAPILGALSFSVDAELMEKIPLSWKHRLLMWEYSYQLIQEAPLIGHGFDSARVFDELSFRAPDGRDITVMSLHPHNIGLQIWLETGLVGVFLVVGFLLALLKAALKTCTQPIQAFAITGLLVTIVTNGALTVGVWQHWWWALIVLAVSLVCLVSKSRVNAL